MKNTLSRSINYIRLAISQNNRAEAFSLQALSFLLPKEAVVGFIFCCGVKQQALFPQEPHIKTLFIKQILPDIHSDKYI